MHISFCATVPKDELYPNEDTFFPRERIQVERIALSDGASESYASRKLAEILVESFATSPNDSCFYDDPFAWMERVRQIYNDRCGDISQKAWWQQQAFLENGSQASLLGLFFNKRAEAGAIIKIYWVGDTCAVKLEGDIFHDSVPYKHSEQFRQDPELLSTIKNHNQFLRSENFFSSHSVHWDITSQTTVLCMTDALAAWALQCHENKTPVWKTLCTISDTKAFINLVKNARNSGQMRTDDTTLLVIDFDGKKN